MAIKFSPEELARIAAEREHEVGFTELLSGKMYRYVVWLTHNTHRNFELIAKQAEFFYFDYAHSLTFWKRTNPLKKEEVCYDIGTTSDDLHEVLKIWLLYRQQTVYDSLIDFSIPVL